MPHLINDPSFKDRRRSLRKNQTDAERKIWQRLRNKQLGVKFYRQYGVGSYILDFYCAEAQLAIELDGGQHLQQKEYDDKRTNFLRSKGIQVIRFWDPDALKETDSVMEAILERLKERTFKVTPPNPLLS